MQGKHSFEALAGNVQCYNLTIWYHY